MESSMESSNPKSSKTRDIIHISLQLLALALLLMFCYNILQPFINPVIWGSILAVTVYPLHQRLKKLFRGKGVIAAIVITVLMLAILVLPALWLALTTTNEIKDLVADYRAGNISIPAPNENVKDWPVIGHSTYNLWNQASNSLDSLIEQHPAEVKKVAGKGLDLLASTGKGILYITLSIIISGVLLSYAPAAAKFAKSLFERLLNSKKLDVSQIATTTIRNVVKGILGVAFIQSVLAGLGMIVGGVPYAGVWIFLCFVLAIIQVGTLPISIGVIIYIWSTGNTLTAILLTIWMLAVGFLDNILKPLVMGKGAPVPMLVIFLGALGGFIFSGIIGLFTGAVILSLGYILFESWLKETEM